MTACEDEVEFMKYALIPLALLLSGCASMVLPPKTPDTTLRIDQQIYVEPYRYPAYSRSLHKALEGADIFTEVRTGESRDPEPYVARVNRRVHGNAVIPFLTFISLGIIPTITEEEFGESFFLVHEKNTHDIEATWKGKTVLGWAALILNVSPNRTFGNPERSRRYDSWLGSKIQEAVE